MTNEELDNCQHQPKTLEQQPFSTTSNLIDITAADNDDKIQQLTKGVALKRSLEEHAPSASGPEPKKMAASQTVVPSVQPPNPLTAVSEDWSVPDKMVGLIIGRDGKQITRLQQESNCKVQLSSDSNGTPERPCVLIGSKQAVEKAKEMISALISRGQEASHKSGSMNGGPSQGEVVEDVPCPANKAGLVIGRNGDTIRGLQSRAGVKMVLLQDSSGQGGSPNAEKPIRITGEPHKVEMAKKMVLDLINGSLQNGASRFGGVGGGVGIGSSSSSSSHMDRGVGGFPGVGVPVGPTPVPGEPGVVQEQLLVPQQAVGVVIGKHGEMIKRIQHETGARVQFQGTPDETHPDRICVITGQSNQVLGACGKISDLIASVLQRDDEIGGHNFGLGRGALSRGGGRGAGRGGFRGGRGGGRGGHMTSMGPMSGLSSPTGLPEEPQIQMQVPASKCGLVIGKGGETIRSIMSASGAYIELCKTGGLTAAEKFFIIRGSPQSIESAQQLISEKIGSANMMSSSNGTPSGYQPNYGGQYPQAAANQYASVAQTTAQNAWTQAYQQSANGSAQWGQPPAAATPNGDMNKSEQPSWTAFYQYAYTQQAGNPQQGGQQPGPPAASPGASNSNAPASTTPGATADYSQAWIDYYRQLGMFHEAECIERQMRSGAAVSPVAQQQGGAPNGPSGVAQNGAGWGASPYGTPATTYGAAQSAPTPYSTYGYPSA